MPLWPLGSSMAPHFPDRCARCGLGVTPELGFETADAVVCPHCYRQGRRERGVRPDPGLPRPP